MWWVKERKKRKELGQKKVEKDKEGSSNSINIVFIAGLEDW